MASAFDSGALLHARPAYAKRISSHLAAALVIFALLQIFIIAKFGGSLVLHLGIIVAIGGFAMAARTLEHRWATFERAGLPTTTLSPIFRRDLFLLWSASIFGATLWVPIALVYRTLFG